MYSQKSTLISDESIADFRFLCDKLERVHPYPFWDRQEYFEQEKKRITKLLQDKEMTVKDFYLTVSPYIAALEDGHSNMLPIASINRMNYLNSGGLTIPVKVLIKNGSLIVREILSDSYPILNRNDTIL